MFGKICDCNVQLHHVELWYNAQVHDIIYPSLTTDVGPEISECHYRIAGSHWGCGVPAV